MPGLSGSIATVPRVVHILIKIVVSNRKISPKTICNRLSASLSRRLTLSRIHYVSKNFVHLFPCFLYIHILPVSRNLSAVLKKIANYLCGLVFGPAGAAKIGPMTRMLSFLHVTAKPVGLGSNCI